MANPKHAALLRRGVNTWNGHRPPEKTAEQEEQGFGPWDEHEHTVDLSGIELRAAKLTSCNLYNANLSDSILDNANLENAFIQASTLGHSSLIGANLRDVDLMGCDCTGTNFSNADLRNANIYASILTGANFSGANLSGCALGEAGLGGTLFLDSDLTMAEIETCYHHAPSTIDFPTLQKSGRLPRQFLAGCGVPALAIDYLPSMLEQTIRFYSCFISYSHQDSRFARKLYLALQRHDINCWMDEKQLLPGDDIYEQIDRAIDKGDKILLCCSAHSMRSWWVDFEIGKAFMKEQRMMKERGQKVLAVIPLDLDGSLVDGKTTSGKLSQLRERYVARFSGWERDDGLFDQQVGAIIEALRADELARGMLRQLGPPSVIDQSPADELGPIRSWLLLAHNPTNRAKLPMPTLDGLLRTHPKHQTKRKLVRKSRSGSRD